MLTLVFYAGADDAPPRLPLRVLSSVIDARLTDEDPPRLVYSTPALGLVSRGRDDVSYLPLTGPIGVFDGGRQVAMLNAGPEVLTIPALSAEDAAAVYSSRFWRSGGHPPAFIVDTLSPEQRRRMRGGGRIIPELRAGWPIALTPPQVIDTVGGFPALALALQKEGYSFGSLTEGFGWWFGKWTDAAENGSCGAAGTLREAILGAEEHYRDTAERTPGDVGAAMRTRAGTILERARREDCIAPHKPLHARRIPLEVRAGDQVSSITIGDGAVHLNNATLSKRIFPPVPAEDWLPVDLYPSDLLGRGERLAVMVADDEGNVGRAFRGADGTWWHDLAADATPEQLEFDPVRFSYLPAPHRFACRTCWAWLGLHHRENCPAAPGAGPHLVIASDTPPAEPARPLHSQSGEQQGLGASVFDSLPGAGWKRHNPRDFRSGGLPCETDRFVQVAGDDGVVSKVRTAGTVYWGDGLDCDNPVRFWREAPSELLRSVEVRVNGTAYEVFAGTLSGRQLYDRVGNLSGMMLVDPSGKFIGDADMVDIEGGEVFTTTAYRDDALRPGDGLSVVSAEVEDKALNVAVQAPEGHVVVMLNGIPKAVDPAQVSFVDDLWRVLQVAPASGLKVNKPGQVTRPLPDPNAAYKLEHGDAFESFLCERRLSRAAPVQITVDGSERLLTPGVYTRDEADVLFGSAGFDLSKNGHVIGSGNPITVERGDRFSTDIPF